jgi:hypothetical protein
LVEGRKRVASTGQYVLYVGCEQGADARHETEVKMAKANFTYACGHEGSVVERNRRAADRRAAYLASQDCWECQKAAQSKAAAEAAQQQGLPALTGTPKQIAWAESIRQQTLAELEKASAALIERQRRSPYSEAAARELEDALALIASEIRNTTNSKTWIEDLRVGAVRDDCLVEQIAERHLCPTLEAETEARRAARSGEAV